MKTREQAKKEVYELSILLQQQMIDYTYMMSKYIEIINSENIDSSLVAFAENSLIKLLDSIYTTFINNIEIKENRKDLVYDTYYKQIILFSYYKFVSIYLDILNLHNYKYLFCQVKKDKLVEISTEKMIRYFTEKSRKD